MSLIPVMTVAIFALAEAGYKYNLPSASFVLPGNQPTNFQSRHIPHHTASQNFGPINSGNTNSGYLQRTSPLGTDLNRGGTYDLRPVAGSNQNKSYGQTSSATTVPHHSTDYKHPFIPAVSNNLNSGYVKGSILPSSAQSNSGYVQRLPSFGNNGLSFANTQLVISASSSNLLQQNTGGNLGYPKSTIPKIQFQLNKGYVHNFVKPSVATLNPGYPQPSISQNLKPSRTSFLINGNAHKWMTSSNIGNMNSGHTYTVSPSDSGSLNNGYAQIWLPSGAGNFNSGYSQTLAPSSTNSLSNVQKWIPMDTPSADYSQRLPSSASIGLSQGHLESSTPSAPATPPIGTVTSGYSQISKPYLSTSHPNTGLAQPSWTVPANVASSNHAQTFTNPFNGNSNSGGLSPQSIAATTNNIQSTDSKTNSSPASVSDGVPAPSILYKHVYFHVPPPEDAQKIIPPSTQKVINYKIMFIKVPSQDRNIQQIAQIRDAAAETVQQKTLIYVLVKRPEAQKPEVPQQTTSMPEVFFVKYNGDPLSLAEQVNKELDKSGSVRSKVPLQPGLVNGIN